MTGRHRRPRRLSKEGRRLLGGAALLAVFAPVTVYTLNAAIAHVRSCGTETTLTVAASPEIAPVLEDFVAAGGGAPERGSDVCAEIAVAAVPPGEIESAEADVWIPESILRLRLPDSELDEQWTVLDTSTAAMAVGLALPAGEDPNAVRPETAPVALEDPRTDPASLLWMVMFGIDQEEFEGDADAYRVMSVAEVERANAEEGADLQAPIGAAQVAQFEYPMLIAADIDDARREAAYNLLRSYNLPEYAEMLTAAGFQPPVPQPPDHAAAAVEAILAAWDAHRS